MCAYFFHFFLFLHVSGGKFGYEEFAILPGVPFVINDISDYTVIVSFLQANLSSLQVHYISEFDINETFELKSKDTFKFNCKSLIFSSTNIQKLSFWKIPNDTCQSSVILLQAEHQLTADIENLLQQFPICIFTQLEGNHFYLTTSAKLPSDASITYFSQNLKESHPCVENKRISSNRNHNSVKKENNNFLYECDFHSPSPFFLKINGSDPSKVFKMTISYRINYKKGQKNNGCAIKALPTVSQGGLLSAPAVIGDSTVICTNLAQDTLNKIISLIVTIMVTIAVLFAIRCIGAMNIFEFCQFNVVELGYQKPGSYERHGSLLE